MNNVELLAVGIALLSVVGLFFALVGDVRGGTRVLVILLGLVGLAGASAYLFRDSLMGGDLFKSAAEGERPLASDVFEGPMQGLIAAIDKAKQDEEQRRRDEAAAKAREEAEAKAREEAEARESEDGSDEPLDDLFDGVDEIDGADGSGTATEGNRAQLVRKNCNGEALLLRVDQPCPIAAPTPPVPQNASSWISQRDYPRSAERDGEQGRVGFRLAVGANGRVQSCSITNSSGSLALDSATCSLIQRRAKFKPATVNGQPVSGNYSNSVTWQIR